MQPSESSTAAWERILPWGLALWDPERALYDVLAGNPGEDVLLREAVAILPLGTRSNPSFVWITDRRLLLLHRRAFRRARLISVPKASILELSWDKTADPAGIVLRYSMNLSERVCRLRAHSWKQVLLGAAAAGAAAGAGAGRA